MNPKIRFNPRWEGVHGLAITLVSKYFAMLCAEHEFDDLMQEAYIVFMKCKRAYPHIDNQKWFTSLYGNALANKLLNLAARCGRMISLEDLPPGIEDRPDGAGDEGYARVLLAELAAMKVWVKGDRWRLKQVRDLLQQAIFDPGAEGRAAYRKLREMLPSLA